MVSEKDKGVIHKKEVLRKNLAPIILFVYNRPWHTVQTLSALKKNELCDQAVLYIYADGPKPGATEDQLKTIKEVREIIRSEKWCKEVYIIESEKNKGLAASIIDGVTEVVNKHKKAIVLEDDIVSAKGFLQYMNAALDLYENEEEVGCVHAWNYNLDTTQHPGATFFLRGADCWGWATWKRSWDLFNRDGSVLLNELKGEKIRYEFNRRGTHGYVKMLHDQINGENDSWAIRWHASLFLADKYCLQPARSTVKNIGLDNSGVHCSATEIEQHLTDYIPVRKIKIEESEWFYDAYNKFLYRTQKRVGISTWQKSKNLLKHLYRR